MTESTWQPARPHDDVVDLPAPWGTDPDDDLYDAEEPGGGVLAPLHDTRACRERPETLAEAVDWARHADYTTTDGDMWRRVNVAWLRVGAPLVVGAGRTLEWVGLRLSRVLLAVPLFYAVMWLLFRLPVTSFVMEHLDPATWIPSDPPGTVVVPIPPGGEG